MDLQKGLIHVRRVGVYVPDSPSGRKRRVELAEPKSGRRAIRLDRRTLEVLRAHRDAMGASPLPKVRVFTTRTGQPLRRSDVGHKQWHPLVERAELLKVGFHSLSAFATFVKEACRAWVRMF